MKQWFAPSQLLPMWECLKFFQMPGIEFLFDRILLSLSVPVSVSAHMHDVVVFAKLLSLFKNLFGGKSTFLFLLCCFTKVTPSEDFSPLRSNLMER